MKEIRCDKCGCIVAKIEAGSRLIVGLVMLCPGCAGEIGLKRSRPVQGDDFTIETLREMMGMKK